MVRDAVGIILARGGSKGIPGKNIIAFCGRPLIQWTITQMARAGISRIVVSTDSSEIAAQSQMVGAHVIDRPAHLASDTAIGDEALIHAVEQLNLEDLDVVVLAQTTSPLRTPAHIAEAMSYFEAKSLDSLFSGIPFDDICVWEESEELTPLTYDYKFRGNRQDRKTQYVENGSFYISQVGGLRASKNRLHGKIGVFPMPKWSLPEIDELEDLRLAEAVFQGYDLGQFLR